MTRIIIIGAGIAGLAAATYLRQHGLTPTLLEARDRYGGRIWVESTWGFPVARGAHWIHGMSGNPMIELAQQFSTPLANQSGANTIAFTDDGQMIPEEIFDRFNNKFNEAIENAKNHALNAKNDCAFSMFVNMLPFIHQSVLYCYVGGDTARALEKLSDHTIVENVMMTLQSAFGKNIPQPTRYYMTRWGQDSFSNGAYSYVAVGAQMEDFIALAKPIDERIFFAGEATNAHLYDATTHGAYLSGIHAAKRIIENLPRYI